MNTWKRRGFTFHVSSFCQMMNCWKFFPKQKIQRGLCNGPLALRSLWLSHLAISTNSLFNDRINDYSKKKFHKITLTHATLQR